MSVLVVVESLFGNTRELADAIAAGLREARGHVVDVVDVAQAPHQVPDGILLLVVGAPTHAFSMSRENTRTDAVRQGAAKTSIGIREWIEGLPARADLDVVTFDTRVKVPGLPGSAAKSAAKALREKGFGRVERGRTFWVHGKTGPLGEGELARARAWGAELAAHVEGP